MSDEWKVDSRGRRYKVVNHIHEYETMCESYGGIDVPFDEYIENQREIEAAAAFEIQRNEET